MFLLPLNDDCVGFTHQKPEVSHETAQHLSAESTAPIWRGELLPLWLNILSVETAGFISSSNRDCAGIHNP